MLNYKVFLMPAMILLLSSFDVRSETEIMNSATYEQAKGANLWIIRGWSEPRPGETYHWVQCADISVAQGPGGFDSSGYRVVVVNVGKSQWVWTPVNSLNPCLGLQRTIPRNPLKTPSR